MAEIVAECTKSYRIGTRGVTVGTRALIVGATGVPFPSVKLQIIEPKAGTELRAGEVCDVPVAAMSAYWRTMSAPAAPSAPPTPGAT